MMNHRDKDFAENTLLPRFGLCALSVFVVQ